MSLYGYGNGFYTVSHRSNNSIEESSIVDELVAFVSRSLRFLWDFCRGQGRGLVMSSLVRSSHQLRRNLAVRRLLSFPHLLVLFWVVVLLWGERWVFGTKVDECQWDKWENWPVGSKPHHLVLVADPQLIDPHSYPDRPWPIQSLTVLVTDNYLRRSYNQLLEHLRPDTIFFLGDLFDGGREWKTAHGEFADPEWGKRPGFEKKLLKKWYKKYGEDFWLREYGRFSDLFIAPWKRHAATHPPRDGQRGRKLVTSLPGNHDLGFGSEIKVPVRDRFEAYFGEGNRVDVIGNHTFVSVDTVSLSADTSAERHSVENIYKPTELFLKDVRRTKRKAVARELRFLKGEVEEVRFPHRIEGLAKADFSDAPKQDPGEGAADLPSVLLTHVPLYRPPGTPCGPLREHWPPKKPPKGQKEPVIPDHRNAISVSGGYQYQNVLSEQDSINVINSIGHVVHAFSGDDHDYCEVKHDAKQGDVPEITVKSISMAMGVPTPGFLLVSLYHPVDAEGKPLPGAPEKTLQTHLCLLPSQLRTYVKYGALVVVSLLLLAVRAFLVPILNLTPFALEPLAAQQGASLLPTFNGKAKTEGGNHGRGGAESGSSGFSASMFTWPNSHSRGRSQSTSHHHGNGRGSSHSSPLGNKSGSPSVGGRRKLQKTHHNHHQHQHSLSSAGLPAGSSTGRWGWGGNGYRAPKIEISPYDDDEDDGYGDYPSYYDGGKWKAARSGGGTWNTRARRWRSSNLAVFWRELWTTTWRVAWMVVCLWIWLSWKG